MKKGKNNMNMYHITVGFYPSEKEWRLAKTTYRDEDDHYTARIDLSCGNNTEEAAKAYFDELLNNGGRFVRMKGDPFGIGILHGEKVYTSVDVWTDIRTAYCYEPYHFYE